MIHGPSLKKPKRHSPWKASPLICTPWAIMVTLLKNTTYLDQETAAHAELNTCHRVRGNEASHAKSDLALRNITRDLANWGNLRLHTCDVFGSGLSASFLASGLCADSLRRLTRNDTRKHEANVKGSGDKEVWGASFVPWYAAIACVALKYRPTHWVKAIYGNFVVFDAIFTKYPAHKSNIYANIVRGII